MNIFSFNVIIVKLLKSQRWFISVTTTKSTTTKSTTELTIDNKSGGKVLKTTSWVYTLCPVCRWTEWSACHTFCNLDGSEPGGVRDNSVRTYVTIDPTNPDRCNKPEESRPCNCTGKKTHLKLNPLHLQSLYHLETGVSRPSAAPPVATTASTFNSDRAYQTPPFFPNISPVGSLTSRPP